MSVSVISRPQGVILNDTMISATITNNGGTAEVQSTGHGLTTGKYVYVKSRAGEYNGFHTITSTGSNSFKLDGVTYTVDIAIIYQKQSSLHNWNAGFLPIVYELSNDRWPTNSVYNVCNFSSFANDNGYTKITVASALGLLAGIIKYDHVQIKGAAQDSLNGVWQILGVTSTTVITIDMAYNASNNFTGATVQLHNSNYSILVNIWGGIPSGHSLNSYKPISLLATLKLIPDTNNRVKFSVHEIIKTTLPIKNNTLSSTLPNNIDSWTGFYIEYAETFDSTDGTKVVIETTSFTSDASTFTGYAASAKLAFKNKYAGMMSEFMDKFLTLFTRPILFGECNDQDLCYQDVSFIIKSSTRVYLSQAWYLGDDLIETTFKDLGTQPAGIIRIQPDVRCQFASVDLSIVSQHFELLPTYPLSSFTDEASPNPNWFSVGTNFPGVTLTPTQTSDNLISPSLIGTNSGIYTGRLTFNASGPGMRCTIEFYSTSFLIGSVTAVTTIGGTDTNIIINTNLISVIDQIKIKMHNESSSPPNTLTGVVTYFNVAVTTPVTVPIRADINCDCAKYDIKLTWLNNLGGFDYWTFKSFSDHTISISDTGVNSLNIMPEWPNSYGEFADTEKRQQVYRDSVKQITVRSQALTQDQADALSYIKSSILVQIINSVYDRRTVIVDSDSFLLYRDNDKTFSIQFTLTYTDDISAQIL